MNFQLNGITHDDIEREATEFGPVFESEILGLYEKVFLSDPSTGTYGGIYKFRDRESLGVSGHKR